MTWCLNPKYDNLWDEFDSLFPEATWGYEGCGLSDDEVIDLLKQSIEQGKDLLSPSYPEYPPGVVIA